MLCSIISWIKCISWIATSSLLLHTISPVTSGHSTLHDYNMWKIQRKFQVTGEEKVKITFFKVIGHYLYRASKPITPAFGLSPYFCHIPMLQFLWVSTDFTLKTNWNLVIEPIKPIYAPIKQCSIKTALKCKYTL